MNLKYSLTILFSICYLCIIDSIDNCVWNNLKSIYEEYKNKTVSKLMLFVENINRKYSRTVEHVNERRSKIKNGFHNLVRDVILTSNCSKTKNDTYILL